MGFNNVDFRNAIRLGLLAGLISLSIAVIGLVELFTERALIAGIITMGQVLIYASTVLLAYSSARQSESGDRLPAILSGLITGAFSALPLIALLTLTTVINLRQFMPAVSPTLIGILTFEQGALAGSGLLLIVLALLGAIAAAFFTIPDQLRRSLLNAIAVTLTVGLFSEILSNRLRDFFGTGVSKLVFTGRALHPISAAIIFALVIVGGRLQSIYSKRFSQRLENLDEPQQKRFQYLRIGGVVLFLAILPLLLGTYLSEVMNNVGIFILMGLGLNIVVGFAGLLDLGYVAFFAIGAYTMAVLTSEGPLGIVGLTFWSAVAICVLVSAAFGVFLGIPVLRMRGDYLAIVTLGFGEIIRILAKSDLLKPFIGGAQGVLKIPKPPFLGMSLVKPEQFYYVILISCLIAWFVSWRLSESRLGRQWMAMREDEDVAEAMGIKLVATKLLAFGIGAAFSGLAGALFASKLTSIFPHSFKLEISINVLSLIIIGGMGSLPGVVVGALILVGLPELLREFAEYRLLMYGALLVVMMLAKPEGFWPSAIRKRELHSAEEQAELAGVALSESGD